VKLPEIFQEAFFKPKEELKSLFLPDETKGNTGI